MKIKQCVLYALKTSAYILIYINISFSINFNTLAKMNTVFLFLLKTYNLCC